MKKLLFVLLTVFVTLTMNAERVSKQEALLKAQQFMPNKQFGEAKAFARGEKADTPAEYEAFYIFNAGNKGGFVIVSGDDRTEPILGYSDRGCLNPDSVPNNVKWLLGYYDRVLTAIANDKSYTRPSRTRGAEERVTVEPMLYTLWSQGEPFNLKCPRIDETHCVTGCVATSMAQVINYHQWPKGMTSSVPAYTTTTESISMPELQPTQFNWEGHLTTKDLSNLLFYCGQSVQMDYGLYESGAFPMSIPDAMKNVFGYDENIKYISRDDYTYQEWEDIIYGEMAAGHPVIYSGFDCNGSEGHSFVLDGYQSEYFHINWGWGSQHADGYFMLTELYIGSYDFNHFQSAVIGIKPPKGCERTSISRPKARSQTPIHGNTKFFWRQSDGSFSSIWLCYYVMSNTKKAETLQIGFGLYNKDGLIKVYEQQEQTLSSEPLKAYPHYANIIITDELLDGDYWIFPVSRSSDDESWVVDLPDWGSGLGLTNDFYTEFTISNNLLRLYIDDQFSTSTIFDRDIIGITSNDGIDYELWKKAGKGYATVIPSKSGGYSGNIYIPDVVAYGKDEFIVYEADRNALSYCPELVSISTSMYEGPEIIYCPELINIDLREGVTNYTGEISSCSSLESIVYPKSLSIISHFPISSCEKLRSIKFENTSGFVFNEVPLWDEGRLPALRDIYFLSKFPPSINYMEEEYRINPNATVHIPCGTKSAYQYSLWNDWNLNDDIINESNQNQVSWGYNVGDNFTSIALGIDCKGIRETAIHVPSEMMQPYIGRKITGVEFYFGGFLKCWPEYIFVTKPNTEEYAAKEPVGKAKDAGWQLIPFSEPYTITGDELFVGLGRKEALGIQYSTLDYIATDANWGRQLEGGDQSDGIWMNIPDSYPLTLRFIIEGEDLPKDVKLCYPKENEEKIEVFAVNGCTDLLTSYTISWDFDGKNKGSKTFDTRLASGLAEMFAIDIPSDLTGYYHTLTIDVMNVNGEDDAIPANSHLVYDFKTTAEKQYSRRMVLENFVATWCGYSPRGYATFEKLYEKYPNSFISIGIHENDDLGEPVNYDALIKKYTSTPTFLFNRTNHIGSTLEEANATMEEQKDNTDAVIIANAIYASEDNTSVKVKTATTFGFSDDGNADVRIAYVVVEDNVGPYSQSNYYSDPSMPDNPDDYMNEWYKKEGTVEMKFNDVARGINPGLNGLEGSVPTSVVAGKAYEYEYTFELPDNIQDKKNISIVTLLIDNKSGEIINADKTAVIEGELPDIFVEDAVVYEKLDEGKVAITDNGNSGDKCEIPETVTHDGVEYQVTAIAEKAFENKTNMKEVTIPQSVTVIGESAFAGCSNLVAIYCYAENPANLTGTVKARSRSGEEVSVASKVFEGVNKETCLLWVPKGCVATYRNASGWGEFTNIKEMVKPGDANGDGKLSETDRNYIVRHIMGDTPDDFDEEAANLNGDEKIDVADIVLLNQLLGENPSSLP